MLFVQWCPDSVTPWTAAFQVSLSFTVSWSLRKHMSIELMIPSNHLILCCSLPLPSVFPSIRVFSNESALQIRWPKYWSFSISLSNEYSGLISFRMDGFDLLTIQGTFRKSSLAPQFKSISSSTLSLLCGPALTSVQDYWKNHSFDYVCQSFIVGKVMSLLFNMLSRFVTAFLPRSKRLLILWLQSPFAVILEPKKIKFVTVAIVCPFVCHKVMGLDAMIFIFWMLSFKPVFSLSSFTFIKRLFSSSSLSAIRLMSSAYLRLIFLPAILITASASPSLAFHVNVLCM